MRQALIATIVVLLFTTFKLFAETPQKPEKFTVSYEYLYTYTEDSLERYWKRNHIPQVITRVRNAVDMYSVTYRGLWMDSTYIIAKGVLYIPKIDKPAAEMVYCHGTRIGINQSYGIQDLEQFIPIMHAADGYVGYFPFYYGFAGGEKEHVYQHAWTEAMSVIHMIKSGREILKELNVETNGQLFVTGYSQGGHAAAATHKMIEERFPEMGLTASSPMSGAYDMTGVQAQTMYREYDRPHYLPYLLITYDYAYKLWEDKGGIYSVFREPFNEELKGHFRQPRKVSYSHLDDILPKVPADMIVDSLVEVFRTDTSFIFTKKLEENNLVKWEPKAPMRLCACYGDNEVMYQNTESAYNYMKSKGANVHKKIFGKDLSHNPCASFAVIYTKIMFDNMRKGRKRFKRVPFGKRLLLAIGVAQANKKGRKHMKQHGEVENDALSVRKKNKDKK